MRTIQERYHRYVNYGYFEHPEKAGIFHLRIDTWYYLGYSEVGVMHFGVGPVTNGAGAVEAVDGYLASFREAFANLFRLDPQSVYRGAGNGVLLNSPHFVEQLRVQLSPNGTMGGSLAYYDVLAFVREENGRMSQEWLKGGDIWLSPSRIPAQHAIQPLLRQTPSMQEVTGVAEWEWSMKVMLDPASLFYLDNQKILTHGRDVWKRLRQKYPEITRFADAPASEGLDAEPDIVTLADPPVGTPSNNRELSALNLPRLQAAVARWEEITGHPFEWAEPFRNLGLGQ